ncbi:MAG: haloalkane dehalogenase [Cyclobacteriaceae bacterium]
MIPARRKFFLDASRILCGATLLPGLTQGYSLSRFDKKYIRINGKKMAYHRAGKGTPVLFLHGNPTSSYLWRNVIPFISGSHLCIAPDLIGMGDSEKLDAGYPDRYTYKCHWDFLDKFIRKSFGDDKIVLVSHDWGGVLAQDWARQHEEQVRGLVIMETFLQPNITGQTPEAVVQWFRNFRNAEFEEKVLGENHFVENVLIKSLPNLSDADKLEYRRPFGTREARLPTLIWPRQAPIDSDPDFTHQVFVENMNFMSITNIPKLFICAEPGAMLGHESRKNVIRQWPNLVEVKVKGNHFIQEQCPDDIGKAIADWIAKL